MLNPREVIVLAGVGNLGKYFCEELISDDRYEVLVISRKKNAWLEARKVDVRITDYNEDSVLSILNSTNSTALISLINCPADSYVSIHSALLNACTRSETCKRFIPSEWVGNVEKYPNLPRFYGKSREPFRQILRTSKIQWTLFNGGWLMDYVLPKEKTYMPPIPDEFPVDPNAWRACIRGTGDEMQSFTSARDVARAVIKLLAAPQWEPVTYVCGEWCTFNTVVKRMEAFRGLQMVTTHKSIEEAMDLIVRSEDGPLTHTLELAMVEEWMVSGASSCPEETTLSQRTKYFKGLKFLDIEGLLHQVEKLDFI